MKTKHIQGFDGPVYCIVEYSCWSDKWYASVDKRRRYKSIRAAMQALKDLRRTKHYVTYTNGTTSGIMKVKHIIAHYYPPDVRHEHHYSSDFADTRCYSSPAFRNAPYPFVITRQEKIAKFF